MENKIKYLKEITIFCLPLIAGQIGQMLFAIGDIAVAGRYSLEVLSALGIASAMFAPFLMVGIGITFAVGPLVAKQIGKNERSEKMLSTSIVTAILLSLILWPLVEVMVYYLPLFKLAPNIESLIGDYLHICSLSLFGVLVFQVIKEYLQAEENTYFANGVILLFNVINILLNIVLMFGYLGFPELGIKGAAIATLVNRSLMALTLFVYVKKKHQFTFEFGIKEAKELLSLGLPIGGSTIIEVMVWSIVTVLVGKMNIIASASHNIVLNITTLTFMIPMAISSAAAVKVGQDFGKENYHGMINWSISSIGLCTVFMTMTALVYFFIPEIPLRFGTDDQVLLTYGAKLLFFVAIFQIPDGIQYTLMGCLRGIGVTKTPMILSFIANWCVGLPIGYYLAFYKDWEAAGLWVGLACGLYFLCISLAFLFRYKMKKIQSSFVQLS